jgi:hypothetical protein
VRDPGLLLARVLGAAIEDGALGLALGQVRVVEAHDARDGVDAGLLELGHRSGHVDGLAHDLRLKRRNLGAEADAPLVVFEVDHRCVHARARDHAGHALGLEQVQIGIGDVQAPRALPLLGHLVDERAGRLLLGLCGRGLCGRRTGPAPPDLGLTVRDRRHARCTSHQNARHDHERPNANTARHALLLPAMNNDADRTKLYQSGVCQLQFLRMY